MILCRLMKETEFQKLKNGETIKYDIHQFGPWEDANFFPEICLIADGLEDLIAANENYLKEMHYFDTKNLFLEWMVERFGDDSFVSENEEPLYIVRFNCEDDYKYRMGYAMPRYGSMYGYVVEEYSSQTMKPIDYCISSEMCKLNPGYDGDPEKTPTYRWHLFIKGE